MKLKRMVSFLLANKYNRWIPCLLSQTDARLCHCVCQFFARICARGTWAMSISIVFMGFSFVCDFIKSIYEISRSDILLPNMYLTCIILFATEYLFRMLPLKCEHFFVHLCIEWIRFFLCRRIGSILPLYIFNGAYKIHRNSNSIASCEFWINLEIEKRKQKT